MELFFKRIKQYVRVKRFYGTSDNAVKTQIWTAVSVYVLVAIINKRLGLGASLYTLLQVLSVTVFEKMPIVAAFSGTPPGAPRNEDANQVGCSHDGPPSAAPSLSIARAFLAETNKSQAIIRGPCKNPCQAVEAIVGTRAAFRWECSASGAARVSKKTCNHG